MLTVLCVLSIGISLVMSLSVSCSFGKLFHCLLLIFIAVMLVHNIMQVQHCNSIFAYTTVCSPPKVWFPSVTIQVTPFTRVSSLHPSPSGKKQSVVHICEFVSVFVLFHVRVKSDSIYLSPLGLLHLPSCPRGLSVLSQMARFGLFYG